jgi:hypothetical protein
MFKKFQVKHFRGFDDLKIDGLKQISLFGGRNNVGKTSLLEGFFIHCGQTNAEIITRENLIRGLLPARVEKAEAARYFIGPSFYNGDLSVPIQFKSVSETGKLRTSEITARLTQADIETILPMEREAGILQPGGMLLKLCQLHYEEEGEKPADHDLVLSVRADQIGITVVPPHGPLSFKAHFIYEGLGPVPMQDAMIFSALREEGKESLILNGLNAIDPSIKNLEVLSPAGAPSLYVNLASGRRMPLPLLGQGSARLAHILLVMLQAADGIILIDEMAYGLHYSVLPEVWKVISEAARQFNVQVIATTHSFEVIAAGHRAFMELDRYDQFGYSRLEIVDGKIQTIHVDRESLSLAIDTGFEIR